MLDAAQLSVMNILFVITGISIAYCFIVGEIARNNSQMDKLWSILPAIYLWVVAAYGGMSLRLVVMAVLATLWGCRLTYNFARKGAYSWKFWSGEEDYRWPYVRTWKIFQSRWAWALFDLLFISIYQNVLVLMTTFPAVAAMSSTEPFGWIDVLATVLVLFFLIWETVADEQQWKFQTTKWGMIHSGKKLAELPAPYNLGFNTTGLWGISRHPNYLGEQGIWCSLYIFSIGAGAGVLNWSIAGAVLLVLLFQGSAWLAEKISSEKYPKYRHYCKTVSQFFPGKRYHAE